LKLFTIGFTKSSAENFFSRIRNSGAKKLLDVRLNNISQLAGFAKRDDLQYFLREICHIPYQHEPRLAPTQQMLDEYKKKRGAWEDYEKRFLGSMAERHIEEIDKAAVEDACLLCSEDKPHHCHRRLVAEYLREKWGDIEIVHL